jgi:hypothetical protein
MRCGTRDSCAGQHRPIDNERLLGHGVTRRTRQRPRRTMKRPLGSKEERELARRAHRASTLVPACRAIAAPPAPEIDTPAKKHSRIFATCAITPLRTTTPGHSVTGRRLHVHSRRCNMTRAITPLTIAEYRALVTGIPQYCPTADASPRFIGRRRRRERPHVRARSCRTPSSGCSASHRACWGSRGTSRFPGGRASGFVA